ncbi:DNA primase [Canibacter sp. lx-72]|uniref:DNA primase n=1 Tax=Canibacter zhuwentaonis TaxID=2837491 RepID=UPI001BDC3573|nr:DNA primase [Canibacter zhuwentaonis]MBT1018472.1 DNA primase [Canibacter zhuwentaonis]
MAGIIPKSDIAAIKQRINIVDLLNDYVTLKRAGVDSFKGLCPFHEERTPSFHVSLNLGTYHCFGCGESGDAIRFLENYEHLSFIEAVENLAGRINYTINYEAGDHKPDGVSKTRLYVAHQVAGEFYAAQLNTQQGQIAVDFLAQRGFDREVLERFGVGYSPNSWNALFGHLMAKGFRQEEILESGLVSRGSKGVYDRFRGRIMWPIRDSTGQPVGFGARRLLDSDTGPKYLNSPESDIYHKAQLLYGIDLAKRVIAKNKRAVIVEGYTDVMACHLAGIECAVATCGTAFGAQHVALLRRILGDDSTAEVIFTFDPDSAGQAAALKAYGEELKFSAQTYVANNLWGLDPSDLRQQRGDDELRNMFNTKTPLFEFALEHSIQGFDLNAIASRFAALQNAAPIVKRIRSATLRAEYTRELAIMLGMELGPVRAAVANANPDAAGQGSRQATAQAERVAGEMPSGVYAGGVGGVSPDVRATAGAGGAPRGMDAADGGAQPGIYAGSVGEQEALKVMIQYPQLIGLELLSRAMEAHLSAVALRDVRDAVKACLPSLVAGASAFDVEEIVARTPERSRSLVRALACSPLPVANREGLPRYCKQIVRELVRHDLENLQRELRQRLQRMADVGSAEAVQIQKYLSAIEQEKRNLRLAGELYE